MSRIDLQVFVELGNVGSLAALQSERYAHGGADTDCRCAANDHGANHFSNRAIVFGEYVGFFQRQLRLVEKPNAGIGPFKRFG